nr:MAG TPA: relaxin [Caudoviricetes sp.]
MSREKMISIFRVCGRELCEAFLTQWIPFHFGGGGFFAR